MTNIRRTEAVLVKHYSKVCREAFERHTRATGRRIGMAELKIPSIQRAIAAHPDISRLTLNMPDEAILKVNLRDMSAEGMNRAKRVLLAGRQVSEEAIAGDATRIKKAPDTNPEAAYLLHESKIFYTAADLLKQAIEDKTIDKVPADQRDAGTYMPYSLGAIHMYKAAFEVYSLAKREGKTETEAIEALKSQVRIVVLPDSCWEEAVAEFYAHNYFGFKSENILFMIQPSLPGMTIRDDGEVVVDPAAPKKKYNHGSMKAQYAIPEQIFRATLNPDGSIASTYVSEREIAELFSRAEDMVSYSIEDMDMVRTGEVADLAMLSVALEQRDRGMEFLMEVVLQNMEIPQKGGFLTWDPVSQRALCLEVTMSGTLIDTSLSGEAGRAELRKIGYLNRNFNHTMDFASFLRKMREALVMQSGNLEGTMLGFGHPEIKEGFLFPQPPQGDMNLNLTTVFVAKTPLPVISGLKERKNIPAALAAMYAGASQEGFRRFIEDVQSEAI